MSAETFQNLTASLIVAGVVFLISMITRFFISRFRKGISDRHFTSEHPSISAAVTIFQLVIIAIGGFIVLKINGVDVTGWVAGLGIVGSVALLCVQEYIRDIIMGIRIAHDDYFSVGDVIKINDIEGVVIFTNLKTTKVEDIYNHNIYSICNRHITQVLKISTQVDIDVRLSYEESLDHVYATMKKICHNISEMNGIETCIFKGTQGFTDYGVLYKIRFYCSPIDKLDLGRNAHKIIMQGLEEANIRIPYPKHILYNNGEAIL